MIVQVGHELLVDGDNNIPMSDVSTVKSKI